MICVDVDLGIQSWLFHQENPITKGPIFLCSTPRGSLWWSYAHRGIVLYSREGQALTTFPWKNGEEGLWLGGSGPLHGFEEAWIRFCGQRDAKSLLLLSRNANHLRRIVRLEFETCTLHLGATCLDSAVFSSNGVWWVETTGDGLVRHELSAEGLPVSVRCERFSWHGRSCVLESVENDGATWFLDGCSMYCWTLHGDVLRDEHIIQENLKLKRHFDSRDWYFRVPMCGDPSYGDLSVGYVELRRLASRTGYLQVVEEDENDVFWFNLRTHDSESARLGQEVEIEISHSVGICTVVDWTNSLGNKCIVTHIPLTWAKDTLLGRCMFELVASNNFSELTTDLPDDSVKQLATRLRDAHQKTCNIQRTKCAQQ